MYLHQKINLKNKWYLNFLKPNQHLTTESDCIMIRVRKYTCKIQVIPSQISPRIGRTYPGPPPEVEGVDQY
jgi:hypothetical protein